MRTRALLTAVAVSTALLTMVGTAGAATAKAQSVVRVTALKSGLQFNTKTLHAHHGRIKLVFTNLSPLTHNVRIELGEKELGGTKTIAKGVTSAMLTLKKGTYNFYCSVPGHEDAGMRGTLVVS